MAYNHRNDLSHPISKPQVNPFEDRVVMLRGVTALERLAERLAPKNPLNLTIKIEPQIWVAGYSQTFNLNGNYNYIIASIEEGHVLMYYGAVAYRLAPGTQIQPPVADHYFRETLNPLPIPLAPRYDRVITLLVSPFTPAPANGSIHLQWY